VHAGAEDELADTPEALVARVEDTGH